MPRDSLCTASLLQTFMEICSQNLTTMRHIFGALIRRRVLPFMEIIRVRIQKSTTILVNIFGKGNWSPWCKGPWIYDRFIALITGIH